MIFFHSWGRNVPSHFTRIFLYLCDFREHLAHCGILFMTAIAQRARILSLLPSILCSSFIQFQQNCFPTTKKNSTDFKMKYTEDSLHQRIRELKESLYGMKLHQNKRVWHWTSGKVAFLEVTEHQSNDIYTCAWVNTVRGRCEAILSLPVSLNNHCIHQ